MGTAALQDAPAAIRQAEAAGGAQLAEVDKGAQEQLALARSYPAGRSMQIGGLMPTNLEDAVRVANLLAKSALIPKDMREKPADVLAALMLGADVGLPPMQALQSIAVINGRPSMWGDGMLAVVMAHPAFEDIAETWEEADGGTAVCQVWRKGRRQPTTARFSHADAQKANLLSKDTYKSYEKRMLKMRARSWALRDTFPDALRGIIAAEEAQDIPGEVIASEVVRTEIPMPERRSIATAAEPAAATAESEALASSPAAPAPQSDELPAAADKLAGCQKNGPASNGHHWWVVRTVRGVEAYTWSTTIGGQLEAFHKAGTPIDLDTEKDGRGDNKIVAVAAFDPLGGGGREVGAEG